MRNFALVRSGRLSTAEQIAAVFRHRALYELAELIPARQPVGRRAHFPGYLLLGYGVLARLYRSGIRVQTELAEPATWAVVQDAVRGMRDELPDELWAEPGDHAPLWDAYRYVRDRYLTDPETLTEMQDRFTVAAVAQAREFGLLDPGGPGSLCHPHRSRAVYGDGTVIRPLYRPPAAKRVRDARTGEERVVYLDPATGAELDKPTRRFDPDAAEFHGHAGPVHGNNMVCLYARGDAAQQRVVLAVDRVERPGHEAETAVALIKRLHAVAGSGMQAVIYDGALRGRHLEELMTTCGLVVVNKVAAQPQTAEQKVARGSEKAPKWFTLGTWEHDTAAGPCTHQLAAVDGAVSEISADENGDPVVIARLVRRQVKRPRRASGNYHFNVAYEVPCDAGSFLAWVTPHGQPGDPDARRAENVRIIAEGEDDFTALYGLRNDAESFNAMLKRTFIADRAMSLGWRRQLLDVLAFGLLHNAVTGYRAAAASRPPRAA